MKTLRVLYWFEWLGIIFIVFGFLLRYREDMIVDNSRFESNGVLSPAVMYPVAIELTGIWLAMLGVFLFIFRPLILLRWWYSWLPIGMIGALAYMAGDRFCLWCYGTINLGNCSLLLRCFGIDFIILAPVFLVVQFFARRKLERESASLG